MRALIASLFALAVLVWLSTFFRGRWSPRRLPALTSLNSHFDRADRDGDGKLDRSEFEAAVAGLDVPSHAAGGLSQQRLPSPSAQREQLAVQDRLQDLAKQKLQTAHQLLQSGSAQPPVLPTTQGARIAASAGLPPANASDEVEQLPQCSLLFFYHIVKTAGTTMRTVLQRQTQLGDFEYIYVDTTKKPRWQLLMHQLTHPVAKRRIIIELHSEWGLPRAFFADIRKLRPLYEPLGCRFNVGTVLRHPLSFYLAWFNWRASNYMPLCQWDPPRDPQTRQLTGYGLPFVSATLPSKLGGRRLRIPVEAPLSVLKHFDVVGFTERFDESLLLLAHAAGMRHLGYARLADNQKPKHPKLAKALLERVLADARIPSLLHSFDFENSKQLGYFRPANRSMVRELREQLRLPPSAAQAVDGLSTASSSTAAWSKATLEAAAALDAESLNFVTRKTHKEKADCNFYPCAFQLHAREGVIDETLCKDVPPSEVVGQMLSKTETDRAVHAMMLARFERHLDDFAQSLARQDPRYGANAQAALEAALRRLRASSDDVRRRRLEQIGQHREKLCGVKLCGDTVRSCVGCEPNPVPGLEPCWPMWEDQFSPDERKFWCKRMMTYPGYDKAEIAARTYPKVIQIPCWRTCWEKMNYNDQPSGRPLATCLEKDMPTPLSSSEPGPSCGAREVHCSPACTKEYTGTLKEFWGEWETATHKPSHLDTLGITCPCGGGG